MRNSVGLEVFGISLGALMLAATPAGAQVAMETADLPSLYDSLNDCWAATASGSIDADLLRGMGWNSVQLSDADGQVRPVPPHAFRHEGRATAILLTSMQGEGLCSVVAQLSDMQAVDQFLAGWGEDLPEPDANNRIVFRANGRPVIISGGGSPQTPRIRVDIAAEGAASE